MQDYLDKFKNYAQTSPFREVCGLVVDSTFYPCNNISTDDNSFVIDPIDYIKYSSLGKIEYICHSHLGKSSKATPSDIYSANKSTVPWVIYAVESDSFTTYTPNSSTVELLGRPYHFGVLDCFSIISDIYESELGIIINRPFVLSEEWFKHEVNYFEDHALENNFFKVKDNSLNKYDVILFKAGNSKVPNHSGVKYDGNTFIHHVFNRLSTREIFGGYWNKCAIAVYRHEELK